ncbi:hypothetical protein HB825_05600 [Listeria booriae]|uniref:hypothetical protein n=1 Tax=Listeria booriae TaxID=1552123 RepID=UPI0016285EAF|nr:hypothetical protein [Listeria booriae]MBC1524806.1 hypothetical protein [Listeria booriae]MBC6134312.1 hypothetical protein [Listeria booriae]
MQLDIDGIEYNTDEYDTYNVYAQNKIRSTVYQGYKAMRNVIMDNKCQGLKLNEVKLKVNADREKIKKYLPFDDEEINSIFIFMEKVFPRL